MEERSLAKYYFSGTTEVWAEKNEKHLDQAPARKRELKIVHNTLSVYIEPLNGRRG